VIETAGLFDPQAIVEGAGVWAIVVVAAIVFIETGLLIGFLLPGDTLLLITGVLAYQGTIPQPIWLVSLVIMVASIAGNQTRTTASSAPRIFSLSGGHYR
jgi:membrane-associated protein